MSIYFNNNEVSTDQISKRIVPTGSVTTIIEYYVDPVDGNDSNTGTQSQPFRTITKALSEVPKLCDSYTQITIYLEDGIHTFDNPTLYLSGYVNCDLIIMSVSGNADDVIINGKMELVCLASYIIIQDLTIIADKDWCPAISIVNVCSCRLSNVKFGTDGVATNTFGIIVGATNLQFESIGDTTSKVDYGIVVMNDAIVLGDNSNFGNTLKYPGYSHIINLNVLMTDSANEKVGVRTLSPTATMDINGSTGYNQLRLRTTYTPTGTADTNGNTGDVVWDGSYIYIKTSAGWKRASLDSF